MKRSLIPVSLILGYMILTVRWLQAMITPDEAATYLLYAESPLTALFGYTLPNNHLLHSLLVWVSTSLIGGSEFAIRLPSYFAGVMALAAVHRLADRLGGKNAAAAALILMATGTAFTPYTVQARGNSLAILLTILLIAAVIYRSKSGYAIMAMAGGLILTLPTMIFLNAAVGLWALRYQRKVVMPLIVGTALGSMFYASMFLYRGLFESMAQRFGNTSLAGLASDLLGTFSLVPAAVWVMGGALIAGVVVLRRQSVLLTLIALICIVPIVLAPIQFALSGRFFYARNYLYLAGVIAPIAGVGLEALFRRFTPLILLVWLIYALPPPMDHPMRNETSEALISLLDERVKPEGAALLVGCCYDHQLHYYRGDPALYDVQSAQRIYAMPTMGESLDALLARFNVRATCTRFEAPPLELYQCAADDQ